MFGKNNLLKVKRKKMNDIRYPAFSFRSVPIFCMYNCMYNCMYMDQDPMFHFVNYGSLVQFLKHLFSTENPS